MSLWENKKRIQNVLNCPSKSNVWLQDGLSLLIMSLSWFRSLISPHHPGFLNGLHVPSRTIMSLLAVMMMLQRCPRSYFKTKILWNFLCFSFPIRKQKQKCGTILNTVWFSIGSILKERRLWNSCALENPTLTKSERKNKQKEAACEPYECNP